MDLNLEGKRAVVTGASLGIGEASVKMLAEHGADVSFCARNKEAVDALSTEKIKKPRVFLVFFRDFGIRPRVVMNLGDQSVMKRESALDPLR